MENNLYIAPSNIHGNGLFTKVIIEKDACIMLVSSFIKPEMKHKITEFGKMVNHSCKGNTFVRLSNGKYWLYALIVVEPNEELTSNYSILSWPFKSDITGYK